MSESTEMTTADLDAIAASMAEGNVVMHSTILGIWQDVLTNVEEAATEKVTPIVANRIMNAWPRLEYADIPAYWTRYYEYVIELRDLLSDIIATDAECLLRIEHDGVDNKDLYKEVLFAWSNRIQEWEEDWDVTSSRAGVELAAMADVGGMFVGPTGLTEHLSQPQIRFEYTEADRAELGERLHAAREGRG